MKPRILLVEDDEGLGETLKERLEQDKYRVKWAKSVTETKDLYKPNLFDLVVLDLRLPDGNGFELAEMMVAKEKDLPFLFLTAQAGAQERLRGFELGAAEFIPKPFHLKEFLIRLERVVSLTRPHYGQKWKMESKEIHLDSFLIKNEDGQVTLLSKRDCSLLALLLSDPEKVFSRSEILDYIVGEDSFPTERTIDNAIVRLRDALGEDSIRNVRGVGYQWMGPLKPLE
ncbi:response regulator receiver domain protein [Leptospira yanagawae serovar Saopaulo str. Sao Paulo = ATCC 700523]|uniref:Response regulator receiver domain protein n=1 Tax=Leptospira yanagawae serovar Saopaulo str. Sao Paulo = ATCC 700523 TaxID=1249483 RepID=A0A5E8HJ96_9LEPT|nr:response regulator transcription factor [Leptospira yanagawae]EOQ90570.1 response regulator receiver domain protein [Leptospira yanagawae serovar Saopaulo str. Sao Paulo = ATCC 700523]